MKPAPSPRVRLQKLRVVVNRSADYSQKVFFEVNFRSNIVIVLFCFLTLSFDDWETFKGMLLPSLFWPRCIPWCVTTYTELLWTITTELATRRLWFFIVLYQRQSMILNLLCHLLKLEVSAPANFQHFILPSKPFYSKFRWCNMHI